MILELRDLTVGYNFYPDFRGVIYADYELRGTCLELRRFDGEVNFRCIGEEENFYPVRVRDLLKGLPYLVDTGRDLRLDIREGFVLNLRDISSSGSGIPDTYIADFNGTNCVVESICNGGYVLRIDHGPNEGLKFNCGYEDLIGNKSNRLFVDVGEYVSVEPYNMIKNLSRIGMDAVDPYGVLDLYWRVKLLSYYQGESRL